VSQGSWNFSGRNISNRGRDKICNTTHFAKEEHSTNNTTEYEALLLALRKMKALGQQNFIIRTDSKVIQEHIEKESEEKTLF
jgi:ribonuclease HI